MAPSGSSRRNESEILCYTDVYKLILECSKCRSPKELAVSLLEQLEKICYYDNAVVLFLNPNGKVTDKYLVNLPDDWLDDYMSYYIKSDICPEEFSVYRELNEAVLGDSHIRIIKWTDYYQTDFVKEYIMDMGLKYSWGFCFFDMRGEYRTIISLNRKKDVPFSSSEKKRLKLVLPVLNNIHRHLFAEGGEPSENAFQADWKRYNLTKRETEIGNLLCKGVKIDKISNMLYIAKTTTYKHISNIYKKVGVSSQSELVVKMMNNDKY